MMIWEHKEKNKRILYLFFIYIVLKTLFNIVEAQKYFERWWLCYKMMFRWTNKQPGLWRFLNVCRLYQDINDWIAPFNIKTMVLMVYSNTSQHRRMRWGGGARAPLEVFKWPFQARKVIVGQNHLIFGQALQKIFGQETLAPQTKLVPIRLWQTMGETENGKSSHLHILTSLKILMLLKCIFFPELNFYTISQTLIACRVMQLIFF